MNLKNELLAFYEKSRELERAKENVKSLRLSIGTTYDYSSDVKISILQRKIDIYMEIENLIKKMSDLPSELVIIQSRLVHVLTEIGFPERRKISIVHQNDTEINFWYDGSDLFFAGVAE